MILQIDTAGAMPIYEQLRNQIVLGIAAGRLKLGQGLPSVRRLAADLGINFHTVNKSYAALHDEGYVLMDRRAGAVVSRPKADEDFALRLGESLRLTAAEAICHEISEEDFANTCRAAYRAVEGERQ